MADLVNLRLARKRREREKKEAAAAANRVASGTPKALRRKAEAERDLADRKLDSHRLGPLHDE
jgi:hypothetical protein